MTKNSVIGRLDESLKPLGFKRHKATWNRRAGDVVEVIDVQVSKTSETITLNAGVLDMGVHVKLWGREPPAFVEEPDCTVRARVGELIDGKDLWWQLGDNDVSDRVVKAVSDYVLPFVKSMCSRRNMTQWLLATDVAKKKYPLPIINLAILQSLSGNSPAGCALLMEVQKRGTWRERAAEVAERLGCPVTAAHDRI
jgi:hypothetical protein